jgi:hypothetical protein
MDMSERGLLATCAAVFRKASQFKYAEELFKRIGDVEVCLLARARVCEGRVCICVCM